MWKLKQRILIKRRTGCNKRYAKQYLSRYCKLEKANDLGQQHKTASDSDDTFLRVKCLAGLPAVLK